MKNFSLLRYEFFDAVISVIHYNTWYCVHLWYYIGVMAGMEFSYNVWGRAANEAAARWRCLGNRGTMRLLRTCCTRLPPTHPSTMVFMQRWSSIVRRNLVILGCFLPLYLPSLLPTSHLYLSTGMFHPLRQLEYLKGVLPRVKEM